MRQFIRLYVNYETDDELDDEAAPMDETVQLNETLQILESIQTRINTVMANLHGNIPPAPPSTPQNPTQNPTQNQENNRNDTNHPSQPTREEHLVQVPLPWPNVRLQTQGRIRIHFEVQANQLLIRLTRRR